MDIKVNASILPHANPEESLAFYRDVLGWEVRNGVGYEGDALDHGRARGPAGHGDRAGAPRPRLIDT